MGKQTKFIFVTGGVVSSIGKGLASASMGALMEARGLRVTHIKLDPYINVDPGTMSPYQHGEVFVTDDGAETDLDLGHYERFSSVRMTRQHNLTSGRIYQAVIEKERRGEYLGATVQVIPHVTDEIKTRVRAATDDADVAIIEVGGTVGDIESLPFLEALRQMKLDLGPQNAISVHVTLVPYIATAGELKTKPTQHSVKEMREIGIQPDVLICRTHQPLTRSIKEKIALFSNVPVEGVIAAADVGCIYELPLALQQERLDTFITDRLNIWSRRPDLASWQEMVRRATAPTKGTVRIGIIGKYVHLRDAYKSLHEALVHGGMANEVRVELEYVDSEKISHNQGAAALGHLDAILVAPGFGERGTEGKIETIRYARTQGVPFFGICLGMQMAVAEFARNVCGLEGANSTELDADTPHPVIDLMFDQRSTSQKGGTMRLGAYPCVLKPGTRAAEAYGTTEISERHRHRYEFSNNYREQLEKAGLTLSGTSPDGRLVEVVELADHPYFLGCQFHPEFKSRPMAPHPLFTRFVRAAMARRDSRAIPKPAPSEAVPALSGLGQSLPRALVPRSRPGPVAPVLRPTFLRCSPLGNLTSDPSALAPGPCTGKTVGDVIAAMKANFPDTEPYTLGDPPLFSEPQYTILAGLRPDGVRLALLKGWGDCPSGCAYHSYRYFETGAGCALIEKGSYTPTYDNAKQCYTATGQAQWGVPSACSPEPLCDAPTVSSQTLPVYVKGQTMACEPPSGGAGASVVEACGTLSIEVDPNDPLKATVTLSGTGVAQLDGKPLSAKIDHGGVSVFPPNQPPGSCLEQLDITLNFSTCSGAGNVSIFEAKATPPDCQSISCKGSTYLDFTATP